MLAGIDRELILEVGWFVDVKYQENWCEGYILKVAQDSIEVLVNQHGLADGEQGILTVAPQDVKPVFSAAPPQEKRIEYALSSFSPLIRLITEVSDFLRRLSDIRPTLQASNEHLIQFHICQMPLCFSYISTQPEALLDQFPMLANLSTDYLKELLQISRDGVTSSRALVVSTLWKTFCWNVKHNFNALFGKGSPEAVLSQLQASEFFEVALSLLESEGCKALWLLNIADVILIHNRAEEIYLLRVISGYQSHLSNEQLEALWTAGSGRYPFLEQLESINSKYPDFEKTKLFCQNFIMRLLHHPNLSLRKNGASELLRLIQKGNSEYLIESAEVLGALSQPEICSAASQEIAAIFAITTAKKSIASILEVAGTNAPNLAEPAVLFPILEKKDWAGLQVLITQGFRLSSLKCTASVLQLLVFTCIARTIPVGLFQRLVDIPHLPNREGYFLINRRYSHPEQMKILHVLSPSHISSIPDVKKLSRHREAVLDMIVHFDISRRRLEALWIIERFRRLGRIPNGLLRCIICEFAFAMLAS